jgi:hypothetical protein
VPWISVTTNPRSSRQGCKAAFLAGHPIRNMCIRDLRRRASYPKPKQPFDTLGSPVAGIGSHYIAIQKRFILYEIVEQNSIVKWNGSALVTTFVNGSQLRAVVTAEEMATAAEASVTVFTPPQSQPVTFEANVTSSAGSSLKVGCSGGTSNALNFKVQP